MPQFYRLSPVLWDRVPGQYTASVYSVDRMPEGPLAQYVSCTARCKDDPAYWWAGSTFLRLVMPAGVGGCCSGPQDIGNGVVYAQIPSWISWALGQGYQLPNDFQFSKIGPQDDITLIWP